MNLLLSFLACFAAIQTGALVWCVGLMVWEQGIWGIGEGLATWVVGQFLILPMALISMVPGALVRMILGFLFENAKRVSIICGAIIGCVGAVSLMFSAKDADYILALSFLVSGGAAGVAGGWVWWRVEKPYLEKQGRI